MLGVLESSLARYRARVPAFCPTACSYISPDPEYNGDGPAGFLSLKSSSLLPISKPRFGCGKDSRFRGRVPLFKRLSHLQGPLFSFVDRSCGQQSPFPILSELCNL